MAYAVGEDRSDFQDGGQSWSQNAFGFTKFTEGVTWKSETAPGNWSTMKAQGVHRGAYHFFHPAVSPVAQANYFVSYVNACGGIRPGDMFACDAEISVGDDGFEFAADRAMARMHVSLLQVPRSLQDSAVGDSALAFCTELAELVGPSCPVLLYTYMSFRGQLAGCAGYPLWIASYSGSPPADVSPWPGWVMWQNSDTGGQGGGDSDLFSGDDMALRSWIGRYTGDWTEVMMSELPVVRQGMRDPVGGVNLIGRVQVLAAYIGAKNDLGAVTQIEASGEFGASTAAAIRAVQGFFGLARDGVVGPLTWQKLVLG
jgi:GH25 family lysozyme M1 (1,4-beta-N-acetylmuramidase)